MRAIPAWTSVVRSAPMTPMPRPPTAMPGCSRKPRDKKRSWAIWDTSGRRTATAWRRNPRCTRATPRAEGGAARAMAEEIPGVRRVTLGADKNYDTQDFVREIRWRRVTPHVAQNNTQRRSAIDQRTTRHAGYAISQRKRKRVEEIFGWVKTVGLMRKVRHRGRERVAWMFTWTAAIYNLVRMGNLLGATA